MFKFLNIGYLVTVFIFVIFRLWSVFFLKKKIIAAGEEVMGTTTIQKKNVERFYEECREKIAKKNEARRRMLQKETRVSYEKYKELQKEAKKVCKKKKKNIYRSNLRKQSS